MNRSLLSRNFLSLLWLVAALACASCSSQPSDKAPSQTNAEGSSQPSDEEIKALITKYEKEKPVGSLASVLTPCIPLGHVGIKISKKFQALSMEKVEGMPELAATSQAVMDALAINGLITMTKTLDETMVLDKAGVTITKKYDIDLTPAGRQFLIGESGDDFVLSYNNPNSITITERKELPSKSYQVYYQMDATPVFKSVSAYCKINQKEPGRELLGLVEITKKNGAWAIVEKPQ